MCAKMSQLKKIDEKLSVFEKTSKLLCFDPEEEDLEYLLEKKCDILCIVYSKNLINSSLLDFIDYIYGNYITEDNFHKKLLGKGKFDRILFFPTLDPVQTFRIISDYKDFLLKNSKILVKFKKSIDIDNIERTFASLSSMEGFRIKYRIDFENSSWFVLESKNKKPMV